MQNEYDNLDAEIASSALMEEATFRQTTPMDKHFRAKPQT